jgi:succinate-semialdehyde dehydrogenase/glutarate-semialdehyde dehydrogenase
MPIAHDSSAYSIPEPLSLRYRRIGNTRNADAAQLARADQQKRREAHPEDHVRRTGKGRFEMADYAVINPATGETVQEYPTISDADLEAAIGRADKAHTEWALSTTVEERAALVRRVGELHGEHRERLSEIIVREMGKPIEQALGEVDFCVDIYGFYADNATKLMADEPIELLAGEGSALIRRSSFGVLLGIMPWNYPYYQVARFAGPNLVIGNTILLKHAPQCPESAAAIEQLFQEAGFPPDAYINIYATNDQIKTVIEDPRVHGVSVTGSQRAGAAVAEVAGRNLKKVVLELGGSDPFILLSTNDMDAAVEAAVGARLENTGQACNAAKRFIVVDELYEPFLEKFTDALTSVKPGDPSSADTTIGPLSSSTAADRLDDQVKRAVNGGAKLVAGGERHGNFYPSTVLTEISPDNPGYREEFFGPVASVYRVPSEDAAVELANDTPFGLGSYVMTNDPDQALRVADKIEAGMVFVNVVGADGAELPFGGVKRSGFGRELGRFGADEFVNKKLIRVGG